MQNYNDLIEYTKQKKDIISVLKDENAIWLFGYIFLYGPIKRYEIAKIVTKEDETNLDQEIASLIKANIVQEDINGLQITDTGSLLATILRLSHQYTEIKYRFDISCDVFSLKNAMITQVEPQRKAAIIEDLVNAKSLHGVEGEHYGFVEFKAFDENTVYGYFTQQYLDRTINYDELAFRHIDWNYRFSNLLIIWPLNTQILILQDTKFFQAPTLNMSTTHYRILMLLDMLLKRYKVASTGDIALDPYKREVTKEEMISSLLHSEQSVSEAELDIGKVRGSVEESLPVFNPREDWNDWLKDIVNEYELPNVASAKFLSTKYGTLSKSKIVKLYALAGTPRKIKLGRGKQQKTIRQIVPAHIGRIKVTDPITKQEVNNILTFINEGLKLDLPSKPNEVSTETEQMRFEI